MANPYSKTIADEFGDDAPLVEEILMGENPQYYPVKTVPNKFKVDPQTGEFVRTPDGKLIYDENGAFAKVTDVNGNLIDSYDYGLMRINNGTFYDMQRTPAYKRLLDSWGISTVEDLNDPAKSVKVARLLVKGDEATGTRGRGWKQWYAGPLGTRPTDTVTPAPIATQSATPKATITPQVLSAQRSQPEQKQASLLSKGLDYVKNEVSSIKPAIAMAAENTKNVVQDWVQSATGRYESFLPNGMVQTASFGIRNQALWGNNPHEGTDFRAALRTPVTVPDGWVVERIQRENKGVYGKNIILTNPDTGERIQFAHLDDINNMLQPGSQIMGEQMRKVAITGNTGHSTGPHLHVNYWDETGQRKDISKFVASEVKKKENATLSAMGVKPAYAAEKDIAKQFMQSSKEVEQKPWMSNQLINPGDTLSALAKKNQTTVDSLMRLNPQIKDANKIYAGDRITVPVVNKQPAQTQSKPSMTQLSVPKPVAPTQYNPLNNMSNIAKMAPRVTSTYNPTNLRASIPTPPVAKYNPIASWNNLTKKK